MVLLKVYIIRAIENDCYNLGNLTSTNGLACNLIGNIVDGTKFEDSVYINPFGGYWYQNTVILSTSELNTFIPTPNTDKGQQAIVTGSTITGSLDCGISNKFDFGGKTYTINYAEDGSSVTFKK